MDKLKPSIIIFTLFVFAFLSNTSQAAGLPTISYNHGVSGIDSVTIETTINPNGSSITAWVEYGTGSNLINFKETKHNIINTINHGGSASVSIKIPDLSPSTLYYLRIAVNNGENTSRSNIIALQTLPSLYPSPQNNTIEQVATTVTTKQIKNNTKNIVKSTTPKTKVEENKTKNSDSFDLSAIALFGQDFLPRSIPNWIALIAMILIMSVLFIKIYSDEKNSPKLE